MSLVRTLAKVAIGVAVAKGVSAAMRDRNDGVQRGPRTGELGGLGGLASGGGLPAGSPLAGMLGRVMEGMGSGTATTGRSTYGTANADDTSWPGFPNRTAKGLRLEHLAAGDSAN